MVQSSAPTQAPLESFVRDYVEIRGGAWDEIEPQVYDILLPPDQDFGISHQPSGEVVRIAFDPEAVLDHPGSQLVSFGTTVFDRLLGDAAQNGRFASAHVNGLNLAPHDFFDQLRRSLSLADKLDVSIQRIRPHCFRQAVFWFQVMFASDQKEYQTLPIAMDLHYARQVRHLDKLLDQSHLDDEPSQLLPDAPCISLSQIYPMARDQVVRTLAPMAGVRQRELQQRVERQVGRMSRYYADIRAELDQQRQAKPAVDAAKLTTRQNRIDHEERVRIAELKRQCELRVQLRLNSLLLVHQPKLLASGILHAPESSTAIEFVWDPLNHSLEAPPCPACGQPTFTIECGRDDRPGCPGCRSIRESEMDRESSCLDDLRSDRPQETMH